LKPLPFIGAIILCTPAAALAQVPAAGTITLGGLNYAGTGCPAGSVSHSLSPDARVMTLLFDQYQAEADTASGIPGQTTGCGLDIALHVPAGWTFGVVAVDFRGFVDLDPGTNAVESASYIFPGEPAGVQLGNFNMAGPISDDYVHTNQVPVSAVAWSPCSSGADIPLHIDTQLSVQGAHGAVTVDSVNAHIHHDYTLSWKRCNPANPGQRYIIGLYEDVLQRIPADDEIIRWAPQANNARSLAHIFLTSLERRRNEVTALYAAYLGRAPTPQELNAKAQAASSGQIGSDGLAFELLASPEFYERAGRKPAGWVALAYSIVLGRSPQPKEHAAWVQQVVANKAAAAQNMIKTRESRARMISAWYLQYLRRPATAQDLAVWEPRMDAADAQEGVQAAILASPEYRAYLDRTPPQ
jgi:hypothetical protein